MFHVYCVDYVKHCFCEWARSRKFVQFSYYIDDKDYGFKAKQPPNSDTKIEGHTNDQCVRFEKWLPPEEAGPKKYSTYDEDGIYEFTFQFISNDYLSHCSARVCLTGCPRGPSGSKSLHHVRRSLRFSMAEEEQRGHIWYTESEPMRVEDAMIYGR